LVSTDLHGPVLSRHFIKSELTIGVGATAVWPFLMLPEGHDRGNNGIVSGDHLRFYSNRPIARISDKHLRAIQQLDPSPKILRLGENQRSERWEIPMSAMLLVYLAALWGGLWDLCRAMIDVL
jgi:hypothetical protein